MRPRVLPPGSCPEHPRPGANTHRDAAENVSELLNADNDLGSVLASTIFPIFIASAPTQAFSVYVDVQYEIRWTEFSFIYFWSRTDIISLKRLLPTSF